MATRTRDPLDQSSTSAGPGQNSLALEELYRQYGVPQVPGAPSSTVADTVGKVGDAGLLSGNPIGAAIGTGLKIGQFGLNAYASFQEQKRQEAADAELKAERERQKKIAEEERRYRKYLARITQAQNIGQYSQGLEDRSLQSYTKYAT